jgi:hypothetical protein
MKIAKFGLVSMLFLIGIMLSNSLVFAGTNALSNLTLTTNTSTTNFGVPAHLLATWKGGTEPYNLTIYFIGQSTSCPTNLPNYTNQLDGKVAMDGGAGGNLGTNAISNDYQSQSGYRCAVLSDATGSRIFSSPLYITVNPLPANSVLVQIVPIDFGRPGCENTTFVTVDGKNYTVSQIYATPLYWKLGSTHSYAFSKGCLVSTLNGMYKSMFENVTLNTYPVNTSFPRFSRTGTIHVPTNQSVEIGINANYNESNTNQVNGTINEFNFGSRISSQCWKTVPLVTIDGTSYTIYELTSAGKIPYGNVTGFPEEFIWAAGSTHTYSFNTSYCGGTFKNITSILTYGAHTWAVLGTSPTGTITVPETINTSTQRILYTVYYSGSGIGGFVNGIVTFFRNLFSHL